MNTNPEKMEWPDTPIPEISIQCPICNDREHRMMIFITQDGLYQLGAWRIKSIKCKKCGSSFKLLRCDIGVD